MSTQTITHDQRFDSGSVQGSWTSKKRALVALAIILALGGAIWGTSLLDGSGTTVQAPAGATVVGDRDAAFKGAAERYQQYRSDAVTDREQGLIQGSKRRLVHDKEEAFKRAAERAAR